MQRHFLAASVALLLCFGLGVHSALASYQGCENDGCGGNYGAILDYLDGVPIYSNGDCTGNANGRGCHQCVDFVSKYFNDIHDIDDFRGYGSAKNYWHDSQARTDVNHYQNGATTVPPDRGDAIVFGGTVGHIAVPESRGVDWIEVCDQNWSSSDPCRMLAFTVDPQTGIVTVEAMGSNGTYPVLGWIRPINGGTPAEASPGGGDDGNNDAPAPLPQNLGYDFVDFGRAQIAGTGILLGYLNELAVHNAGGPYVVGTSRGSDWVDGQVVEVYVRAQDNKLAGIVYDENRKPGRAYVIPQGWFRDYTQEGGVAVFGQAISPVYPLAADGAFRQDYQYRYIVRDSNGFHAHAYPHSYYPGQGAADEAAFQTAYGEVGGDATIGNPIGPVITKGGYSWQLFKARDGTVGKLVHTATVPRAYWVAGKMLDTFDNLGGVDSCGGPITDGYDTGDGRRRQQFRYCSFLKGYDGNIYVSRTGGVKRYAPGHGVPKREAIPLWLAAEREGGAQAFGHCGMPLRSGNYVYQYCEGGTRGRSLISYNTEENAPSAFVVSGDFLEEWSAQGGYNGRYGAPAGDSYVITGSGGVEMQPFVSGWRMKRSGGQIEALETNNAIGEPSSMGEQFRFGVNRDPDIGIPIDQTKYWNGVMGNAHYQNYLWGRYAKIVTYIIRNPASPRAIRLAGTLREKYLALGGPTSTLGLPVTDSVVIGSSEFQFFVNGWVEWTADAGQFIVHEY